MTHPDKDNAAREYPAARAFFPKAFIAILPVALTVLTILVVLRHVDPKTAYEHLLLIHPGTLAAVFLASIISKVFLASQKWRICLASAGYKIGLRQSILIQLGYLPAALILPSKTGELARIMYLERCHNIPSEVSLSALVYDNLINIIVLISLLAVSWSYLPREGVASYRILLLLPVLLLFSGRFRRVLFRAANHLPGTVGKRFQNGLDFFGNIGSKTFLLLIAIGFAYRLVAPVFTALLLMRDLGITAPAAAVCASTTLIDIAVSFPIGIGGVGAREALYIILFKAYGHPAVLLAAGVAASFVEKIFPALLGLPFVYKLVLNYFVHAGDDGSR